MRQGLVRVIHMAALGADGISRLTVSIHERMDPTRVTFDYLVFRDEREFLEDEVIRIGGRKQVVDVSAYRNKLIKCVVKIRQMRDLFARERYDVVHVDASTPYDVIVAIAARLAGVPRIVMHSHSAGLTTRNSLRDAFRSVYQLLMLCTVTDYYAASESAARFMFPQRILRQHRYHYARNGIRVADYTYSDQDRARIRQMLGLEDCLVVGHVGRFVPLKNHAYIIRVFEEILRREPNAMLLLVGEGALEQEIRVCVRDKGLTNHVLFYGTTHDVRTVLLAMDAFVFPSQYEGLGVAAIEAQAVGLPVYAAETIPEEVGITECYLRIDGWDPADWGERILAHQRALPPRRGYAQEIIDAGYSIDVVAQMWDAFYTMGNK